MPNDDNKIILEFPATNVEIELGETITFDNISGFLDSERVTYNGESLTEKITHLENDKADTTYVNTELDKKADKTDTYTKTQVDNALNNKMNKANPTGTGRIAVGSNMLNIGSNSQTFGSNTKALGNNSFATGENTQASVANQFVFGKYNQYSFGNLVEIVGNGTSESNRSNARTLDWQGNETLAGNLTFNGNKSLTSEISRLDGRITDLPEAMVFKGTLGVGGTIETLPTASAENEGWTFKCITAGTYAGLTLKVGDSVTCFNPPNTSVYEWDISGYGDTDTDTWRTIKVNGTEELGSGISSGSVDFEDTANVKFEFDANGNKVRAKLDGIYTDNEVDDLLDEKADADNTYTKAQVDDIVYGILPDDTASGSVANFDTSLELPIKLLEVDVNAVQESGTPTPDSPLPISGWSEIQIANCDNTELAPFLRGLLQGKYGFVKMDTLNWQYSTYAEINYFVTSVSLPNVKAPEASGQTANAISNGYKNVPSNGVTSPVFVNGTMFIWTTGRLFLKDANYTDVSSFVSSLQGKYLIYELATPVIPTITEEQINTICEAFNANNTFVKINLGGTYYGGYFTQDKTGHRQFEVTHAKKKASDFNWYRGNMNAANTGRQFYVYFNNYPDYNSFKEMLCDSLLKNNTTNWNALNLYEFTAASSNYFVICVEDYASSAAMLADCGNIEFTVILKNPFTITLPDGEPIITINGTNNIYADTGDTSVVFKCSVNDYINAHQSSGVRSLGGVFLGGSNIGSEEEPTEESEETKKTKEIDDPKEEIKTIGEKKIGGE